MRYYGRWAGDPKGRAEDPSRCAASVTGWPSHIRHQCSRKRGHGKDGLFCKQHGSKYRNPYVPRDQETQNRP